jgi:hypothetical protein
VYVCMYVCMYVCALWEFLAAEVQVGTPVCRWVRLYAGGYACMQVGTPVCRWVRLYAGGYARGAGGYACMCACIQLYVYVNCGTI